MIADLLPHILARRGPAVFVALGLAVFGTWAILNLQLEAYPDLSETQVSVVTLYPGHAPEEVEQQVTVPLERALQSVPRVIGRRSRTIFGLSVLDLTFEYEVADSAARQAVLERLHDADLPDGAEPSLAPPTTPAGELYRYTVEGAGRSLIELRELQDWVIAPRFLQVSGVGDAFAFGGLVKQYGIEVDPQALQRYGLSLNRIAEAVGANNQNAGGSLLNQGQQGMVVRGVGAVRSVADIENIVIASSRGVPVFIRDIGRVSLGSAPRNGIFGIGNRPDCVEGIVVMRRGENPSAVLAGVREAVDELNSTILPEGVRLAPLYDRTELVHNTVNTVSHTLGEGLLLVFLVLLFFLGSFEAAILTAITIPFSLLFAASVMYFANIPASLLTLGALDFGIIVDGTLVMVEIILRRLRDNRQSPVMETLTRAAVDIQRPVFFSLLILTAAYTPLFTLERVERRLFTPMAYTISAALAGSALFALCLAPVFASWLFRNGVRSWRNPIVARLIGWYERILARLLEHPRRTVAAVLAAVAVCFALGSRLGTEFLPQLDEGVIWVRAVLPPGVSLDTSAETAGRVRALLARSPEVAIVTSQTGRQESNTEPFGPNRNEFLIALRPYHEWTGRKSKPQLVAELSARLQATFPGVSFNFTQPVIDMVTEAVTGSSADLAVILSGRDLAALRQHAARVLAILRTIPGAADTAIEQETAQPQVRIEVDRQKTARYGINVKDVQDVIELAIGGRPVSQVFEGDRVFDIVVRYTAGARGTLGSIGAILVPAPEGARIPLAELASIRFEDGESVIARREGRRQISVRTNIRGRDQGSFVAEAQRRVAAECPLPPGYRVEWGGQFENLDRARARLRWILPATAALVFALLYWTFGSLRDAALVLANVPACMAGGILALLLRGIPFSVSAAVGFISLFGVSVMTGVLCLSEIQRQSRTPGLTWKEAVLRGAASQFRSGLMLVAIALLGILPATFATGIGSDVQRPLATVIFGGLLSTAVPGGLVFPALCALSRRR